MSKVTLGKRPESFTKDVSFPMHDGTPGIIKMTYKYRTRTEFAELLDQLAEEAKQKFAVLTAEQDQSKPVARTAADQFDETMTNEVARILDIASGWDLDVPFNTENIRQLADELPGAVQQIVLDYRLAITEGRLGN